MKIVHINKEQKPRKEILFEKLWAKWNRSSYSLNIEPSPVSKAGELLKPKK